MVDAFFSSSIPVAHNVVKSIIFRAAELLMGLFMFKFFSIGAVQAKQFTSYLMFSEDPIQRWLFLSSRGFSRATLLVLLFTILSTAASLYGNLLWALDSPGYIFRTTHATLAESGDVVNPDALYVVQLRLDSGTLDDTEKSLPKLVGAGLLKPGLNMSLTGDVNRGNPQTTAATQFDKVGARIWLDSEGFSVSADTYVSMPGEPEIDGEKFPMDCIVFDKGVGGWNCSFHSVFAQGVLEGTLGRPEVHWDDESSNALDSQYIRPNRVDNVWASYGRGAGTAAMMQVFTVTKGERRHTFAETLLRATMLTNPGVLFARNEVDDLVRRFAAGSSATARDETQLSQIIDQILSAQDQGTSYNFGVNYAENSQTVIQNSWSYLRLINPVSKAEMFSVVHLSTTNITLVRSEDVQSPPGPFGECDYPFQNEAFGGKVTRTSCAGASLSKSGTRFYGTVDTAAVMILYGLGAARSNTSAESLDQKVLDWVWGHAPRMTDLLLARGYAVSVDPALVGVAVEQLIAAVSGLQLFLSVLAAVLALAAWSALAYCAEDAWSKTLLANLVHTTLYRGTPESKRGYMRAPPNVDMVAHEDGECVVVEGRPVVLGGSPVEPVIQLQAFSGDPYKGGTEMGPMARWGAPGYHAGYAPVAQ